MSDVLDRLLDQIQDRGARDAIICGSPDMDEINALAEAKFQHRVIEWTWEAEIGNKAGRGLIVRHPDVDRDPVVFSPHDITWPWPAGKWNRAADHLQAWRLALQEKRREPPTMNRSETTPASLGGRPRDANRQKANLKELIRQECPTRSKKSLKRLQTAPELQQLRQLCQTVYGRPPDDNMVRNAWAGAEKPAVRN